MKNEQTELVERIVIEYANFSGRESSNRAQFRENVSKIIATHHRQVLERVEKAILGKVKYCLVHGDDFEKSCSHCVHIKHHNIGLDDALAIIRKEI